MRIAWSWNAELGTSIFAFEAAVDWFFVVDILLNFRTGIVSNDGNGIVMEPELVARDYLRSWFLIDFLAVVPIDAIARAATAGQGDTTDSSEYAILSLLKVCSAGTAQFCCAIPAPFSDAGRCVVCGEK